jgi:hypothetical protein
MTFAHEGNKTFLDKGLVNFEKMQMIAQTLRTIRFCRSKPFRASEGGADSGHGLGVGPTSASPFKKSTVGPKAE